MDSSNHSGTSGETSQSTEPPRGVTRLSWRVNFTRFSRASGVGFSGGYGLYGMGLLEGNRGPLTEGGVPAMRVVPAFDVAEDGQAGFGVRGQAMSREAFDFERGEEALGHRVIIGIAT
jgi:hypothetical protein